jgi:Zn-dependent alcohol dehydrogenase
VDPIWAGTMMDGTPRLSKKGSPVYHYSALACFADLAVVPEASCVPMPASLPLAVAGLIGCAVTTGMGSVLNTAKVEPGSTVAVWGAGGVGLSTIIGADLSGAARIIAVDRVKEKEAIAKSMGATHVLMAGDDTVERVRKLTEGRGADYVFETTGIPEVQEICLHAARPGGTVVLAGLAPMGSSTQLPGSLITRQEKTVMGTYYGTANTARDFPLYADLHLKKRIDLERLISKTYSLEEINEAFEEMISGRQARGVIVF